MITCNHYYYYCKCVLFSITSIFSFMFIILLVVTATLNELPPYRMVLNCFHLLCLYKLYPLLGWLCRLPSWSYSFAFTYSFTCITFNLYYYCITVIPLPMLCLFLLYGLYIDIAIQAGRVGSIELRIRSDLPIFFKQFFFFFNYKNKSMTTCLERMNKIS